MDGNFESNKGKLPVPVTGSYRIVKQFGRHKHPVLEYVTIDSPGIEIEAAASAAARSVLLERLPTSTRLTTNTTMLCLSSTVHTQPYTPV